MPQINFQLDIGFNQMDDDSSKLLLVIEKIYDKYPEDYIQIYTDGWTFKKIKQVFFLSLILHLAKTCDKMLNSAELLRTNPGTKDTG